MIHHIKENDAKTWVLRDETLGGPSPADRNATVVVGPLGGRIRGGLVYEDYSMWQFTVLQVVAVVKKDHVQLEYV